MTQNDLYAVAAGDIFGMVPLKELEGISLFDNDFSVRIHGQNYYLYTGAHADDREKCAELLKRYDTLPLKDYKIEPVVMQGELEFVLPGFQKEKDSLLFGGFCFVCDGKKIPFDFSGVAWNIQQEGSKVSVSFETGDTPFGRDFFLDDCYEGSYLAMGMRIHDITARLLAAASSIEEFMVSLEHDGEEYIPEDLCRLGSFQLKSLSFSDLNREYGVAENVLQRYNADISRDSSVWLCAYRSTLGLPDDLDNLTYVRVPVCWLMDQLGEDVLTPDTWFDEYTADDTEALVRQALADGVLLEYADEGYKDRSVHNPSLEGKIQDAKTRRPDCPAEDLARPKETHTDFPSR